MGPSIRTISKYVSPPLFGVGAALVLVGLARLGSDPHARVTAAVQLGVIGLLLLGVRRYTRKQTNRIRTYFDERNAHLDRKLTTYETIANELNVVIAALPADMSDDARRAVWNIGQELRMSIESEAADVRRPLP